MLVHLSLVGSERIAVFNGRGRGGSLASLRDIPEQVTMHLRESDLFLDASTGDLYKKNGDLAGEFRKYRNIGLHDPMQGKDWKQNSPALAPVICRSSLKRLTLTQSPGSPC